MQGVGFRPFVYGLAKKYHLTGWVANGVDGVHIECNGKEAVSDNFYKELLITAPAQAHIVGHCKKKKAFVDYRDFKIVQSGQQGNAVLLLSPDYAICENCRSEIRDNNNPRYRYAFTTCTACGPRYSIVRQLPYDREHTTMNAFSMCNSCLAEYKEPLNRRHFSQTNSCPACPITMQLFRADQQMVESGQEEIIDKICELWSAGMIVALKGIGGFLLTCDALNAEAVSQLRQRKHRPAKPFAVMFPCIGDLESEVYLNEQEKKELESDAAPIVLLRLKENGKLDLALHQIAPKLSRIGAMLPYTPMYQLLLHQFAKPVIATSGNVSNAPIVYKNEAAFSEMKSIADFVLVHNRKIILPQDDSVVTYSRHAQGRIVLRRSRGFAPFFPTNNVWLPPATVLATGALAKSSFSLLHFQNLHVSQYLGDTDNYDAQKAFEKTLHQLLNLFSAKPEVILVDNHPGYFTSQLGKELAAKWDAGLVKIQHHEAHFASVLGEHALIDEEEPVLGVIWDGTGLGTDNQIWGGEFFIYHQPTFSRIAHFEYFNSFLGDKMATEPRLSAFSLCQDMEEARAILRPKFAAVEWNNYQKLIAGNLLKTSSVGRLFDAVASLLGLIDKTSYEGEAAALLEQEANHYFDNGLDIPTAWIEGDGLQNPLSSELLIKEVVLKIDEGISGREIAAWFHVRLVLSIQPVAQIHGCTKICFSGGVFQNGLLVDLAIKILGEKFQLYFNKDLSPNDENISFGQVIWFATSKHKFFNEKA